MRLLKRCTTLAAAALFVASAAAAASPPIKVGHFLVAHRGFRRPGQGRATRLHAVGCGGQQGGRHSRTTGGTQDRQRRLEPGPSRHQLPEPHHAGQGRHRLWAFLEPADDPGGAGCETLRLFLHRAGRRRTEGIPAAPGQPFLRATRPGGEGGRRVRGLYPGLCRRTSARRRRPMRNSTTPSRHLLPTTSRRDSRRPESRRSTIRPILPSRPTSPRSSPVLPRRTLTSSFREPSRRTHSPRSRR